jgi:hypothetical protein
MHTDREHSPEEGHRIWSMLFAGTTGPVVAQPSRSMAIRTSGGLAIAMTTP